MLGPPNIATAGCDGHRIRLAEHSRMRQPQETGHDVKNLLGIALANVEAMIDGVMPPTTSRLQAIAQALRKAGDLLQEERSSEPRP